MLTIFQNHEEEYIERVNGTSAWAKYEINYDTVVNDCAIQPITQSYNADGSPLDGEAYMSQYFLVVQTSEQWTEGELQEIGYTEVFQPEDSFLCEEYRQGPSDAPSNLNWSWPWITRGEPRRWPAA